MTFLTVLFVGRGCPAGPVGSFQPSRHPRPTNRTVKKVICFEESAFRQGTVSTVSQTGGIPTLCLPRTARGPCPDLSPPGWGARLLVAAAWTLPRLLWGRGARPPRREGSAFRQGTVSTVPQTA